MAIQRINLTVPGGDTPRSANTKINANFSDQSNAASRIVGTGAGQVPLAQDVYSLVMLQEPTDVGMGFDTNEAVVGVRYAVNKLALNMPPNNGEDTYIIETKYAYRNTTYLQTAIGKINGNIWTRSKTTKGEWSVWALASSSRSTYDTTTASGANVAVNSTGTLMRSTSSERYKDILSPLELDDARYADAMALKPIVYRSIADADNPAYHYYSFSAEELGAYDPAFTLWREIETVTDADGNVTEQPLAERQAEGININALLAMGHAIAIKQGELIKDLQDQLIEQKEAIAALQQTNL